MILIADSGTTKTDWCLTEGDKVIRMVQTKGMNPYFQSQAEINDEVTQTLLPQLGDVKPEAVYFYGAGCVFDKADLMQQTLASCLSVDSVKVYSDMYAAVHGLCGREAGIACILGTGSNSCFFDGWQIVKQIPPLGFILGDEGGGTVLGRMLVSDVLKKILPKPLRDAFFETCHLTQAEILDRVYHQPFPNRFLASLSPFLSQHLDEPSVRKLISDSFTAFFVRNVKQYDYRNYAANFIGSVAFCYHEILTEVAEREGVRIGTIARSPMSGLIYYYSGL